MFLSLSLTQRASMPLAFRVLESKPTTVDWKLRPPYTSFTQVFQSTFWMSAVTPTAESCWASTTAVSTWGW